MKPAIEVRKGSIATVRVDAIVNPANSFLFMGGGVALVIKEVGGQEIEEEAMSYAPVQVGEAVLTKAGMLPSSHVIHAPVMHEPAERTDHHKVACAVSAALELADENGFVSVAMPGMGTGVGGLSKKEAATMMVKTIKSFNARHIEKVILIDIDDEMVGELTKAAGKQRQR